MDIVDDSLGNYDNTDYPYSDGPLFNEEPPTTLVYINYIFL